MEADLKGTILLRANLTGANLVCANFQWAGLTGVEPQNLNLLNTIVHRTILPSGFASNLV